MDYRTNVQSDVIQLRDGASEPTNDQLDTAGQTILQLIDRAAGVAEGQSDARRGAPQRPQNARQRSDLH
jgi:hypothetical protein